MLPPVDGNRDVPALERRSEAEVNVTNVDRDPARPPSDSVNSRPPSLLAHESAIEYESFSYATLPNSAPPDVLARWRHLRIHSAARAFSVGQLGGDESAAWSEEACCKKLLRRRVILFLVLLLAGVVMALITVAIVWITTSNKHEEVHSKWQRQLSK